MRSRLGTAFALLIYAFGVFVAPVLHRAHHFAHGADHEHTALGTIYFADAGSSSSAETSEAEHHAALDQELVDLHLGEVAFAGTLSVDCSYAEYTLAVCDSAATPTHPRTFGDDLLAREHHHHAPAHEDPLHGQGSPEHLSGFALSTPSFILPPPCRRLLPSALPVVVARQGEHGVVAPPIRGPPRVA